MAGRAARQGSWLFAALMIAGVLALLWWISARRAETPAPPSSVPGARVLKEAPPANGEEITQPEKQELDRVLREHGSAPGHE